MKKALSPLALIKDIPVFRKARRALAFSLSDWFLLAKMFTLLSFIRLLLKVFSFKTLVRICSRSAPTGRGRIDVDRHVRFVEMASRYHLLRPSCLEKALVLYGILRRRGITAELAIGTTKMEGQFKAHAWVQLEERIILGTHYEPYAQIFATESVNSQGKPA